MTKMLQVACRVCRVQLLRKNYRDHLNVSHQSEDPNDRREWGEADNTSIFKGLNVNSDLTDREGNIRSASQSTDTVLGNENKKQRLEGNESALGGSLSGVMGESVSGIEEDLSPVGEDLLHTGEGDSRSRSVSSARSKSRDETEGRRASRSQSRSQTRGRSRSASTGRSRSASTGRSKRATWQHNRSASSMRSMTGSREGSRSRTSSESSGESRSNSRTSRVASALPNSRSNSECREDTNLKKELEKLRKANTFMETRLEDVMSQVENMLKFLSVEVDTSDCDGCGFKQLHKKLKAIETFLQVKECTQLLDESVKDFKKVCSVEVAGAGEEAGPGTDEALFKCKSIQDIENLGEFAYQENQEAMTCTICEDVVAKYGADEDRDFKGKVVSKKFSNLKKTLKRHHSRVGHKKCLQEKENLAKAEARKDEKEKNVSPVLGHVAYYLLNRVFHICNFYIVDFHSASSWPGQVKAE